MVIFTATTRRLASSLKQGSKPCQWENLVINRQHEYALVRRKLNNSDLPLRVRIRHPVQDKSFMMALLRQHVSRFQSLDIYADADDAEEIVSSIGNGQPAPLLERLNIFVKRRPGPLSTSTALKNAFYPSPRLTHLTLPTDPTPDITIPHLRTVTSLTIDSSHVQWAFNLFHLLDMLESMPQLQTFTFKSFDNFSYLVTSRMDYPRVISMPNLVSADVSAPGCGLDILRALDAPLLTAVRFDGYRPPEYQEDFTEALTRPIPASLRRVAERSQKIKRLELRSTVMHSQSDDYRWLLSDTSFPQLEVLRLDAADISNETLLMGTAQMRNLKRLELLNCKNVSGAAVRRFVNWKGRGKNFEVLIDACPSITEEDIVSLSKIGIIHTATSRRCKPCRWETLVINRQHEIGKVQGKLHKSDLPLRVRIRPPVQDPIYMMAMLWHYVSRFQSLDLYVSDVDDAEGIVSSIGRGRPAPLLERLNIFVKRKPESLSTSIALKNAFYPSPRLIHLSLPSVLLLDITTPHLRTVTSLTIDSVHVRHSFDLFHLLDMLESMPQLQTFTFKSFDNFSYLVTSRTDYPRIISMPNLVSADVSAPGCGLDILRALDAPLLTAVRFDGYRPPEYQEDFTEALTRPIPASLRRVAERSQKIKRLELRSTVMHNQFDDYRWLLSDNSFPQLEVLRLDAADISNETLLMGTAQMRNLKRLELLNCKNVSGLAVKRFVNWKGRGKNFEVLIDACPSITEEDIVPLSKIAIVESKQ